MSAQPNRRQFIRGAAIAASTALVAPLLKPFEAEAQLSAVLSYMAASHPILALVAIIELGIGIADQQSTKTKLGAIASEISDIANGQEQILKQLSNQRIVMREEIRRGFLDNDARELYAASQQFKVALAGDDREEIHTVASRMDNLAFKLPTYGLAAAPAYLSAIALQNSAHLVLKSNPQVFETINLAHQRSLGDMLNGNGENSLAALREQTADRSSQTQFDEGSLDVLRNQIGRRFLFAIVSTTYQADASDGGLQPSSTHEYGVIYKGIKNGKPVLEPYHGPEIPGKYENRSLGYSSNIQGKAATGMDIWFNAVKLMAGDYKDPNLKGLLPYEDDYFWGDTERASQPVNLAADGKGYLTDAQMKIVQKQIEAVTHYYAVLYDARMGPNVTANTRNPQPTPGPSEAYRSMRTLLESGLDSVNKIIIAAQNGQLYSAATAPDSSGPIFAQADANQNRGIPAQPAGYFQSHSPQQPAPQQRQTTYPYGYAPSGTGTP